MGEVADMMLDGTLCEGCGVYLGADGGFPQRCASCGPVDEQSIPDLRMLRNRAKVGCPECGRRVKETGLKDHMRDRHGVSEGKGESR